MSVKISAPRGTKDVLPGESCKWLWLEDKLREIAGLFGCEEIRFPVFEHTELFLRGMGDTTDVVQKEMYTFDDRGGRSLTLRPEGTASVVRALIEHGALAGALPVKVYYIAPNFRYEKPQAGRLRQHHQFGAEIFGPADPEADAELIALGDNVIKSLKIENVELRINSMGCLDCRKDYRTALVGYFEGEKDKLCNTCKIRLEQNPLRILDCKSPVCKALSAKAPHITDYLCDNCGNHFTKLKAYLKAMELDFIHDPMIVRGFDYYTKTVFEFVSSSIGAQGTVLGGGRYDGLTAELGGMQTPALGFGCGIERLLLCLENSILFPQKPSCDIYIASMNEEVKENALLLCNNLRKYNLRTETDLMSRGLKASMKYANKTKAKNVIVLGEDEIKNNEIKLKNMVTGEETALPLNAENIAAVFGGKL